MSNSAFFRLQQLISPSLPIGAFTYSQGMEWAVECGWIKDADDVYVWLDGLLESSVGALELPVLARLYHASQQQDVEAFSHWADTLLAWRETRELRAEECQRGQALTMVLDKLPDAAGWPELQQPEWREALGQTQLAGFALACARWNVDLEQALNGYLWSWLENMVIVAVKLIPLGQSDGQRAVPLQRPTGGHHKAGHGPGRRRHRLLVPRHGHRQQPPRNPILPPVPVVKMAPKPAKNTVGACLHAITQHQTGKNNGEHHERT